MNTFFAFGLVHPSTTKNTKFPIIMHISKYAFPLMYKGKGVVRVDVFPHNLLMIQIFALI